MSETRPKYTKEWLNENLPYIHITKENKHQVSALLDKMGFTESKTDYKPNFLSICAPNEYCFCVETDDEYVVIPAADFIADNIHLLQPEQPVLTPCPDDWHPADGYSISEYEAICIDDSSSSQFLKCGEKQEFTGCFDKRFEINNFCSFYKRRFATPTLKSGAVKKVDQQTFEKFANPELGEPIAPTSPIHQPNHYMKGGIEVGKFISAKGLNFNRGQAIKYICRAGLKDPNKTIEDLQKAIRSLQMEVDYLTELNTPIATDNKPTEIDIKNRQIEVLNQELDNWKIEAIALSLELADVSSKLRKAQDELINVINEKIELQTKLNELNATTNRTATQSD